MNAYAFHLEHWSDVQAHLPRLFEAARGNVLELGVRHGVSTAALLAGVETHGGRVWSIDLDPACSGVFAGHPLWTFVPGNSQEEHLEIPDTLDCLFVDTEHTEVATYAELCRWGPRVRAGGVILLHDTDDGTTFPGVRNAMERWCKETGRQATYYPDSYGLGEIRC